MSQYIKYDQLIRELIITKNLLTVAQIAYIYLVQVTQSLSFTETLLQEGLINNEMLINLLPQYCSSFSLFPGGKNIKILEYSKAEEYAKEGYFFYTGTAGEKCLAINNLCLLANLDLIYEKNRALATGIKITLIKKREFYFLLEKNFSHLNTIKSRYYLDFLSSSLTAKNIHYKKIISIFVVIFGFILLYFTTVFHVINIACYFIQNLQKIIAIKKALTTYANISMDISLINLPIYTILVPLYQEADQVESIIDALYELNYPQHKLDIKIIVEEDDIPTIDKLKELILPSYIQVIKVPYSLPRTKPKALNYAMSYCRGKYVVIYDAEDRPDKDQLLKAVAAFQMLPEEYGGLQAKLNYYNADENLLTRFFSIEYDIWFKYIIKGFTLLNLPVPLGGTSNHLKVEILRRVGGWDAYNVTEDADMGIRLYLAGYKVYMLNSTTLEEAPITLHNWIRQRIRWKKGFLQTFLLFLNQKKDYKKINFIQIMSTYIFIGSSLYCYLCLPWLLLMLVRNINDIINYCWLTNTAVGLVYVYGMGFYSLIGTKSSGRNFKKLDYCFILWPCYFILHIISTYLAIWESIRQPFKWNKTQHGVSTQASAKDSRRK